MERGTYSTLCCLKGDANKVLAENVVEDGLAESSIFIENLINNILL
jgi:hypothetical protein